nr:MAG TPA: hypothetical protein [Caudoviricetes sp.]
MSYGREIHRVLHIRYFYYISKQVRNQTIF